MISINQRIGSLVVKSETRYWGSVAFLCECDCGRSRVVTRRDLLSDKPIDRCTKCAHRRGSDSRIGKPRNGYHPPVEDKRRDPWEGRIDKINAYNALHPENPVSYGQYDLMERRGEL